MLTVKKIYRTPSAVTIHVGVPSAFFSEFNLLYVIGLSIICSSGGVFLCTCVFFFNPH